MDINKTTYDKIRNLVKQVKLNDTYELEVRIKRGITRDIYERIFENLTYGKIYGGYEYRYTKKTALDIRLIDSSNESGVARVTINDVGLIEKYWLFETLDNIEHIIIEKEKLDIIDIDDYNLRISLNEEIPEKNMLKKNINLLRNKLNELPPNVSIEIPNMKNDKIIKYFRLKNRFEIFISDLFRVDLTATKTGTGDTFKNSNTLREPEKYEIEIEYIGGNSSMSDDEITNELLKTCYLILNLMQQNSRILKQSDINSILEKYQSTIKMKNYNTKLYTNSYNNDAHTDFICANPVTLHRVNLIKSTKSHNILNKYCVTLKADGERNILYVCKSDDENNGKIYLININNHIKDTGFIDTTMAGTIIEGEFINNTIYIYDVLFDKGYDVRKRFFINSESSTIKSRYELLDIFIKSKTRKVINEPTIDIIKKKYDFSYRADGSDIFEKAQTMWNNRAFEQFNSDGLIFMPMYEAYPLRSGAWHSLLKWKPLYLNTIDFLIKIVKYDNGIDIKSPYLNINKSGDMNNNTGDIKQYKTLKLFVGGYEDTANNNGRKMIKKRYPIEFNPFGLNNNLHGSTGVFINEDDKIIAIDPITNKQQEILDDTIIEFGYNNMAEDGFKWVPYRIREDKTLSYRSGNDIFGNIDKTAYDIFKSILTPVTDDMLFTGKIPLEESVEETKYFDNTSNTGERYAYQNFHNYVIKDNLIEYVSNVIVDNNIKVFDACMGKGIDIIRFKKFNVNEVVGIDIDSNNVKFAITYHKKILPSPKPRAFYICGDMSKLLYYEQSAGLTNNDKSMIKKYIPMKYYFNIFSIQFALHYFFKNEITLRTLLQNMNDCLKIGGYIIGTCFDGQRVYNALHNNPTIEGKTYGGEIMWSISKQYKSKLSFIDTKPNYGKQIEVFVKTIGKTHNEYLVNFEYLDAIFQEYGFKKIQIKSFETYYNDEVESSNTNKSVTNMSEEEKRFSFFNTSFIYEKVKNSSDNLLKKLIILMEKEHSKSSKTMVVDKDLEHILEDTTI